MDVQNSQSVHLDASPREHHDLHRLMVEVLDLRAKVATLEKVKAGQRAERASNYCPVERRA